MIPCYLCLQPIAAPDSPDEECPICGARLTGEAWKEFCTVYSLADGPAETADAELGRIQGLVARLQLT